MNNYVSKNKRIEEVKSKASFFFIDDLKKMIVLNIFFIIYIILILIATFYVLMTVYPQIKSNPIRDLIDLFIAFFWEVILPFVIPIILLYYGIKMLKKQKVFSSTYKKNFFRDINITYGCFVFFTPLTILINLFILKLNITSFIYGSFLYSFIFIPNLIYGLKKKKKSYWKYLLLGFFLICFLAFLPGPLASVIFYQLANFWNVSGFNLKDNISNIPLIIYFGLIPIIILITNIIFNSILISNLTLNNHNESHHRKKSIN